LAAWAHLGVQFAAKMGFETVAIARGDEKAMFATKLGAHHYIDSASGDVADRPQGLGGAKVVLATEWGRSEFGLRTRLRDLIAGPRLRMSTCRREPHRVRRRQRITSFA
jgi:hypothetical protein